MPSSRREVFDPERLRKQHISYLKSEAEVIRNLSEEEFAAQLPRVNQVVDLANLVEEEFPQWLEPRDA